MNTPNPGRRVPPCENCGGAQVANLGLMSHHHVGLHPGGRSMWFEPLTSLHAVVCLNCGSTKLFASDLNKLRQAAQENPDYFVW